MKITIEGNTVTLSVPGGVDEAGNPTATVWTMTLEQYQKHARDPQFGAAATKADRDAVKAAIAAAAK